MADADVKEITEIVKPCGLGNSKARDIKRCMTMLRDEYNSVVPDNMDDLLDAALDNILPRLFGVDLWHKYSPF